MQINSGDNCTNNQAGRDIIYIYNYSGVRTYDSQKGNRRQEVFQEEDVVVVYRTIDAFGKIFELQNRFNQDCSNIVLVGGVFSCKLINDMSRFIDLIINLIRQEKTVYFIGQKYDESFASVIESIGEANMRDSSDKIRLDIFVNTLGEIERHSADLVSTINSDSSLKSGKYLRFLHPAVVACNHHGISHDNITVNGSNYSELTFSYAVNLKNVIKKQFSIHPQAILVYQYRNAFEETLHQVCRELTPNSPFEKSSISFQYLIGALQTHLDST